MTHDGGAQLTQLRGTPTRRYLAAHLARQIALNGITITALFQKSGVAASTTHKCIKGRQNITLETVTAFAEA